MSDTATASPVSLSALLELPEEDLLPRLAAMAAAGQQLDLGLRGDELETARAGFERALADLATLTRLPVAVLAGGNTAWAAEGLPVEAGGAGLASPRIDRYRRPYEGTDAPREAMQAYLDWEYGLVEQLGRDGTHGFQVLAAA